MQHDFMQAEKHTHTHEYPIILKNDAFSMMTEIYLKTIVIVHKKIKGNEILN